jgi:ABC-type glycerol-3-phosphate transport system permease component
MRVFQRNRAGYGSPSVVTNRISDPQRSHASNDGGTHRIACMVQYGLLTLGAIVMLLPFADMLIGALRTPAERLARPPVYWPQSPQWGNFIRVFTELPMLAWLANSLFVTSAITVIQVATSALAGFALAKYQFRGRELILRFVLVAQIFPFFLFIIPMFFILRYWPLTGGNDWLGQGGTGLLDSYLALILPFAVSWYGVFLMRQFMVTIPDELLDAARVDGAGEFGLFWRIALPLAGRASHTCAPRVDLSLERGDLDHDRDADSARIADGAGRHSPPTQRVLRRAQPITPASGPCCLDRPCDPALPRLAAVLCARFDNRQSERVRKSATDTQTAACGFYSMTTHELGRGVAAICSCPVAADRLSRSDAT